MYLLALIYVIEYRFYSFGIDVVVLGLERLNGATPPMQQKTRHSEARKFT